MKIVNLRAMNPLILALLICSCLTGCGSFGVSAKSIGSGPWPQYQEPKPMEFDDAEKLLLEDFRSAHKSTYDKIISQDHEWRSIVQTHNKAALEHNLKLLEMLDMKPSDIQKQP